MVRTFWLLSIGIVIVFIPSCAWKEKPGLRIVREFRLTSVGENRDVSWSPDGRKLAFSSDRGGHYDIWVVEAPQDTGWSPEDLNLRNLTRDRAFDRYPVWSPDGRWIAYVSTHGDSTEIWAVPSEGGEPRRVTYDGDYKNGLICWSPDGRFIAFGRMREGEETDICLLYTSPIPRD